MREIIIQPQKEARSWQQMGFNLGIKFTMYFLLRNAIKGIAMTMMTITSVMAAQSAAMIEPQIEGAYPIRSAMLENGMRVVVIADHRAPVVTHMVWYQAGRADEEKGKSGIAHFLEHLMFKGTKSYPDGEFSKIVAMVGGQENAFTGQDYTAYYQKVAKQHLAKMMEMEADRMRNLVLSEEAVATERNVILEERKSRVDNVPASILREKFDAALYETNANGAIFFMLFPLFQPTFEDLNIVLDRKSVV